MRRFERVLPARIARVGSLAVGATFAAGVALFRLERGAPPPPRANEEHGADSGAELHPDWCAAGYEPIPGGCLALSRAPGVSQPLVVYLHGRYARNAGGEEVDRQRRLAEKANAQGFAVLALRGRLGACAAAELSSWYCWPENGQAADTVVTSWKGALDEAHRRTHSNTQYVLGFSNGGYFAGLLATRGLLDADAFVVAHAGPVEPVHAQKGKPPMLLLSSDQESAQSSMDRLDHELTREDWAHDSYAHEGGHDLNDTDIDAALAFFTRAHESMPLDPPLPLHRPRPRGQAAGTGR